MQNMLGMGVYLHPNRLLSCVGGLSDLRRSVVQAKSRNGNLTVPVIATSEIAAALEAEASLFEKTVDITATMPEALNPRRNYSRNLPGVKPRKFPMVLLKESPRQLF